MFRLCSYEITGICLGQCACFRVCFQVVDADVYGVPAVHAGLNDPEIGREAAQVSIVAHAIGNDRFCQPLGIEVPLLVVHFFVGQQGRGHIFCDIGCGLFRAFNPFAVAEPVFPVRQVVYLPAVPGKKFPGLWAYCFREIGGDVA